MSSPTASSPSTARATARRDGDTVVVEVGGTWRLRAARPDAAALWRDVATGEIAGVRITARDLEDWDSSLLLFVLQVRTLAAAREVPCDLHELPPVFGAWLDQLAAADEAPAPARPRRERFPITRRVGHWTRGRLEALRTMLAFFGECVLGLGRVGARSRDFRWSELIEQMRRCGAQALGIVGLITFLVGVILAYVGATQFRQVGADLFVADLIGLAMFREMGPMMAAIVLAGRTGAAYAAELGNMRLNEEIDALETFGVRAHDFLVMPRLLALMLMMPLLALYADFLGILGGLLVSHITLDINPASFLRRLQEAVHLNDVATGLVKSACFGLIVAYAGCLKGMTAQRSAVGVGEATTSAVVLAILLIVEADAVFTILFHQLGW